jgi:glycosyltransferase involved in cell wall biosynthesis
MRRFAPDIRLIPNGCDPEPDMIEPVSDARYQRMRDHPDHVIGYVGNLEAKIDIPLLERLADAFPDDLLVLAGSTHANPVVRQLAQRRNVVMPGVLPHEQANAWINWFDVGIIPHQPMALTDNMNPLERFNGTLRQRASR